MFCNFDIISDEDEYNIEDFPKPRKKKVFRNRMEDLEMWDDDEFFMRFRLKKTTVKELLFKIEFHLKSKTNRYLSNLLYIIYFI